MIFVCLVSAVQASALDVTILCFLPFMLQNELERVTPLMDGAVFTDNSCSAVFHENWVIKAEQALLFVSPLVTL